MKIITEQHPETEFRVLHWRDGNSQGGAVEGRTKKRTVPHPTETIEVPLLDANGDQVLGDAGEILYEYMPKMIEEIYSPFDELLAQEASGEIEIQWLTVAKKAAHTTQQEQERINTESQAYLDNTDKWVIRYQETGKPMPAGISEARQAARLAIVGGGV